MKVFGIDTSTMTGSVALIEDESLLGEFTLNIKETHESRLMRTIDQLFECTHLSPLEVDLFAVGVGPGSFTGLRIGLATMKALAQASNKPLVGVSSLEAGAYKVINAESYLCPFIDARKQEVFAALFRFEGLRLNRFLADQVASPRDVLEQVIQITRDESVLFWGSGTKVYTQMISECFGEKAIFPPLCEPSGSAISSLGLQVWRKNQNSELWEILPNYLRKSEAENKWAARNQK